ncbi:MAG TPA: hypothetical protein PLD10_21580 [Rhodopila sp.]|nr:hypothetical protein [Rhodopila sp.]
MQQYSIQLGWVGLRDFEVPASIRFGGNQRVAVHKLYGGSRIVECLGADVSEIRFEGIFTGFDAAARFRAVDDMRLSGQAVWLTWGAFRYIVIVQDLEADYRNPWWIQFQVTCIRATDLTQQLPFAILATLLAADLGSASVAAVGAGINLTALQAALGRPQVATAGSSDRAAAVIATALLSAELEGQMAANSALITSQMPSSATAPAMAAALSTTTDTAGMLASVAMTRGYVARIAGNLAGSPA